VIDTDRMTDQRYATARLLLVRVAELLYERRLTELQGGNMSVRVGDAVVITPTRASDVQGWRLAPEDTLVLDRSGGVLAGDPGRLSRETSLHLRLYAAFADVGSVFHLHLPEALGAAASGRWPTGIVTASPDRYGVALCLLETGLPAQTPEHDGRVAELLSAVPRAGGAISISPGHGVISVARDTATNVRAADVFRQNLEFERVRDRLRRAAMESHG
jgi:L-fuculose-phosphate aldolase